MSELNVIATEMKLDVMETDEGMDAEAAAEHTKKREEKVTWNLMEFERDNWFRRAKNQKTTFF